MLPELLSKLVPLARDNQKRQEQRARAAKGVIKTSEASFQKQQEKISPKPTPEMRKFVHGIKNYLNKIKSAKTPLEKQQKMHSMFMFVSTKYTLELYKHNPKLATAIYNVCRRNKSNENLIQLVSGFRKTNKQMTNAN